MKGGNVNVGNEDQSPGNLTEEDLSTNQQAVPIPWHCGEASFPLRWLCEPFKIYTEDVPSEIPNKKGT